MAEKNETFKDNSLVLGYTFVGIFADYLYDHYKNQLEKLAKQAFVTEQDVRTVKHSVFKSIMPVDDDTVHFSDFETVIDQPEWN